METVLMASYSSTQMASDSSTQIVQSIHTAPGLKWENVTLSVTIGRGKKAVKKELLKVCLICSGNIKY